AITYAKGASVLKQLAALVGEDAFVSAMRSHFAAHPWGNATLADLVGAAEATSGRDLRQWTQQWLDTARTDTARLVFGPGGAVLEVDGYDGAEPREHRVDVGAYVRRGEGLALLERSEVTTSGRRTPLPDLPMPADLFLVNDTDLDVVAVHPDPESRAALLDLGHLLPDAVARAVTVSTAWELMVEAEVPPDAFVDLAVRTLRRETAEVMVEPFLGLALQAAELWAPEGQRPGLLTRVADVALELAATGRSVTGALRALARAASSEAQLDALARYALEDLDLGWRRLVRLAALGRLPSDEVTALQARDPDPDVWVRALSVRAAQPAAAAKDEVWDAVVVTPRVPLGDVSEVAAAFWQPDQAELLRPFSERYLDVLPTLGDAGMIQSLAVGSRMFPVVGADLEFVERADELATAIREPVVARILRERSHELRAMLGVRDGVRVERR
ncbi:MAG TPA: ERAP1-like C-terminal domain-containing protein, partial [Actinomycetes bacterium]|nr:ERAP1-like C-terminal domain-containing protein [Actinomycetes bacterium]